MELGSGFNSLRGEVVGQNPCLKEFEVKDKFRREDFLFSISDIKDASEMEEILDLNFEGSMNYASFEFTIGGDIDREESFDNKNIYYLLRIQYEKDDFSIDNPQLTEEAEILFENSELYEDFRQKCGDQYVATVTTGSQMIALIDIENNNTYDRTKLELDASIFIGKKIKGKNLGLEISGSFLREINATSHNRRVNIKVRAQGIKETIPLTISPDELFYVIEEFIEESNNIGSETYRDSPYRVRFQDYANATYRLQGSTVVREEMALKEYATRISTYKSLIYDIDSILKYPYDFTKGAESVEMLTQLKKELNIYLAQIEYFRGQCQEPDPRKRSCLSLEELENRYTLEFKDEWELREALPTQKSFFPANCLEVKDFYHETSDGSYRIYLGGDRLKPFYIYCHNLDSETPEEYLPLYNQSTLNSEYPTSNYLSLKKVEGGELIDRCYFYSKYRVSISVDSISIYPSQDNFITCNSDSSTELPLLGYINNHYSTESGEFNIDLAGTGFVFDRDLVSFKEITYLGMKFEFIETELSWSDAETFAKSRGGKLVSIPNAEYESEIFQFLEEYNINRGELWTSGKRDIYGELQWSGDENLFFDYRNFEKDSDGEECVLLNMETKRWTTADCSEKRAFLISYDSGIEGKSEIEFSESREMVKVLFSKSYSDLRPNYELILRYKD
jgi:hypothetical protein